MTKSIFAVAAFLFPVVGAAHGADVISVPTSTPVSMPVHDTETSFDWTGFYVGVYGAARLGSVDDSQIGLGLQAGVNVDFDFLLLGAEVAVEGLSGDVGETTHGQILGRAGLVATDDVIVYAAGGYGLDLGNDMDGEALVGGGVEVAVSQDFSVDAQYLHGIPLDGGVPTDTITFGANFHF